MTSGPLSRRRPGAGRLAAVVLPGALLAFALSGCAAGSSATDGARQLQEPVPTPVSQTAVPARATSPVRAGALPAPCSMVDASDVSLYVALSSWDVRSGEQDGRAVCQLATDGYTVTTVTVRLADPANPPVGLCRPPGSTATAPADDLLCGYSGPGSDTATAVVAQSGLAVGVRVVGPDAGTHAALLARHALTHL